MLLSLDVSFFIKLTLLYKIVKKTIMTIEANIQKNYLVSVVISLNYQGVN